MVILFLSGASLAIAFAFGSSIIALYSWECHLSHWLRSFFIYKFISPACMPILYPGRQPDSPKRGMVPLSDFFIKAMFGRLPGGLAVAGIIFASGLHLWPCGCVSCQVIGTVMVPLFLVRMAMIDPCIWSCRHFRRNLDFLYPELVFYYIRCAESYFHRGSIYGRHWYGTFDCILDVHCCCHNL